MSSDNFKNIALRKPSLDYFEVSGDYIVPKSISGLAIAVLAIKDSPDEPKFQTLLAFGNRNAGEMVSFNAKVSRYITEYGDFEFRVLKDVDPLSLKNLNEYEIIEKNIVPITASLMR